MVLLRHPTHKDLHFYIETYLSYFEFKLQICRKKNICTGCVNGCV